MSTLDKDSNIPLYFQLAEEFRKKIENYEWITNSQIPSELKLCENYKISRGTVRQAITELIQEGYIYRKHGLGTFIKKPRKIWPVSSYYSNELFVKSNGPEIEKKVISKRTIAVNNDLKRIMKLNENDKVYQVKSLLYLNKSPVALESSYLLKSMFPNLSKKDLSSTTIYKNFMYKYKLKVSRVKEFYSTILADRYISKKLSIKEKSCILMVERLAWSNNIIFEYRKHIIKTDNKYYTVELI